MVVTFVLDGDFKILPTEVNNRDKLAIFAVDRDLGLWRRVSGLDDHQSQPGLPG